MAKAQESSQEITTVEPIFSAKEYRQITSFDDAIALLSDAGVVPANAADELGDGFEMLDDKNSLIGVPLIFLNWTFHPGDYGEPFVSAHVVTQDNRRYIVNDGGTGICAQLREWTERTGRNAGMYAAKGLRKSEYDNEFGHGVTFYVNTAAR